MKNLTMKLLTTGLLATMLTACGGNNNDALYNQYMLSGGATGCDYQPQGQPSGGNIVGTLGGQGSVQMLMYPTDTSGSFEAQAIVDIANAQDAYFPGITPGGYSGGWGASGSCPATHIRFCVTTQGSVGRRNGRNVDVALMNNAGQRVTMGTTAAGAPAVINGSHLEGGIDITYTGCGLGSFVAN